MTVTLAEAHRIIEGAIAKARELKAEISVTALVVSAGPITMRKMKGVLVRGW